MPVDHEYFKHTTPTQWMWYFYNFMKDGEDDFNSHRDLVEYHAAFIEPEAVREVRKNREEVDNKKGDSDFISEVENMFGNKLNIPGVPDADMEIQEVDGLLDRVGEYQDRKEEMKDKTKFNFAYWTDISLE